MRKKIVDNFFVDEVENFKAEENAIVISDDIYIIKNGEMKLANKDNLKKLEQYYFMFSFYNENMDIEIAKKIIKKIKKLTPKFKKCKNKIGKKDGDITLVGCIVKNECEYSNDIVSAVMLILFDKKKEKNSFLYDNICLYLDNEFQKKNLCEFKNGKCIGNRVAGAQSCNGCCMKHKHKFWGLILGINKKMIKCKYLGENGCEIKSIMCKIATCPEVSKKGKKYTTNNILLMHFYFNFIQKLIIVCMAYQPKEKTLKLINFF